MVVHTEGQRSNYYITLLYCCRFQVITQVVNPNQSAQQHQENENPASQKVQPKRAARWRACRGPVESACLAPANTKTRGPWPAARPAVGTEGGLERKGKGAVRSSLRSWPARSLRILYACFFKRNFTRILLTHFAHFLLRAATVFFSRRSRGGEASDVGTPPATRRR